VEKLPISLVIISLNESSNIERCIRSVPFADEVLVLDSGSSDDTVRKAHSLGAKTIVEKFRGFKEQKIRATELAKNDWIISLDADEALSPELHEKILELGVPPQNVDGYEMPRLSYHLGRWIWHGGWYPDRQLRFFNRKRCSWVGGYVHERVVGKNVPRLREPIHHWVFKDLSDQIDTNNDYSSKGARDLFDKKVKFSIFKLIFKPISKFFETYVWKRGFLDGMVGFIVSVGAAYSVFLKFAKLRELEMKQGGKSYEL